MSMAIHLHSVTDLLTDFQCEIGELYAEPPVLVKRNGGSGVLNKSCDKGDQSLKTAPVLAEVTSFAYRAR